MRPRPTRTTNRLPFSELEPHRFEDMVRQLLQDFRPWRSIEAIGRSGGDGGVDIRAFEAVPGSSDRAWFIQCKREQASIGPARIRAIAQEAVPEESEPPFGFILVAASDFSRSSRDALYADMSRRGVAETYLWGRAELEDLLYLPKNEPVLRTFFDVASAEAEKKQEAYRRWLQFTENVATWAYEPGADLSKWMRQLHDTKAELDYVASPNVKRAMQEYIDNLDVGMAAFQQAASRTSDWDQQKLDGGAAFGQAMHHYRERMIQAMREDTGYS
jgi:hypothetical protein